MIAPTAGAAVQSPAPAWQTKGTLKPSFHVLTSDGEARLRPARFPTSIPCAGAPGTDTGTGSTGGAGGAGPGPVPATKSTPSHRASRRGRRLRTVGSAPPAIRRAGRRHDTIGVPALRSAMPAAISVSPKFARFWIPGSFPPRCGTAGTGRRRRGPAASRWRSRWNVAMARFPSSALARYLTKAPTPP